MLRQKLPLDGPAKYQYAQLFIGGAAGFNNTAQ